MYVFAKENKGFPSIHRKDQDLAVTSDEGKREEASFTRFLVFLHPFPQCSRRCLSLPNHSLPEGTGRRRKWWKLPVYLSCTRSIPFGEVQSQEFWVQAKSLMQILPSTESQSSYVFTTKTKIKRMPPTERLQSWNDSYHLCSVFAITVHHPKQLLLNFKARSIPFPCQKCIHIALKHVRVE